MTSFQSQTYASHFPRRKATKVATAGKGGSGKTMLTAVIAKLLVAAGNVKILAIDADSAISLPYALPPGREDGGIDRVLRLHNRPGRWLLVSSPSMERSKEGVRRLLDATAGLLSQFPSP